MAVQSDHDRRSDRRAESEMDSEIVRARRRDLVVAPVRAVENRGKFVTWLERVRLGERLADGELAARRAAEREPAGSADTTTRIEARSKRQAAAAPRQLQPERQPSAQYDAARPAPVMIFQDGLIYSATKPIHQLMESPTSKS